MCVYSKYFNQMTDFPILLYTSTCEILTIFIYLKPEKCTPFATYRPL